MNKLLHFSKGEACLAPTEMCRMPGPVSDELPQLLLKLETRVQLHNPVAPAKQQATEGRIAYRGVRDEGHGSLQRINHRGANFDESMFLAEIESLAYPKLLRENGRAARRRQESRRGTHS